MTRTGRSQRHAARAAIAAMAVAVAAVAGAGCEDIRRFEGSWAGTISRDPVHQQGFAPSSFLRAHVQSASRATIEMTLDLPERGGLLPFETIRRAAGDALGDLRLEGEPLRTFLGYVRPTQAQPGQPGDPYLAVVSLFPEERIDVRIIRGPDETYAVFSLRRIREAILDAGQ